MSVEQRAELHSFIDPWMHKPEEQVVQEAASCKAESKRYSDPYHFIIDGNGDLFSPSAKCKIKNIINRENAVGLLEAKAFSRIESWFKENEEGVVAWVSPPDAEYYPTSKVIVSEIQNVEGEKRLFNWSIILDHNKSEILKLAQDLSGISQNRPFLSNINEVRSTPLVLNTEGKHWAEIFAEYIPDPKLWESIKTGRDLIVKEELVEEARVVYREIMKQRTGSLSAQELTYEERKMFMVMIGSGGISCPKRMGSGLQTAFQVFANSAVEIAPGGRSESCGEIKCKDCGWKPSESELRKVQDGKLTKCPDCGWSPG